MVSLSLTPEVERHLGRTAARYGLAPDDYAARVVTTHLNAELPPAGLPADESQLLDRINRGLSDANWQRFYQLVERRQQEAILDDERAELTALATRVEQLQVDRLQALVELAQLRRTTLQQLMDELGISPPPVL